MHYYKIYTLKSSGVRSKDKCSSISAMNECLEWTRSPYLYNNIVYAFIIDCPRAACAFENWIFSIYAWWILLRTIQVYIMYYITFNYYNISIFHNRILVLLLHFIRVFIYRYTRYIPVYLSDESSVNYIIIFQDNIRRVTWPIFIVFFYVSRDI